MALVDPLTEDGMDPDLRAHVQFFKGPLGVIPNSVRTMAHRAPIARAFTDLNVAVMTDYGAVTPEFKRLLGYVSSFASGCLYCQAHMILASERFGASEARLNDVFDFEDSAHFTDAEKAALAFAQAATAVPNAVTPEVGDRLKAHWPPEAIVEIMGVVALFGYLNRWNDSMGSALEDLPIEKGEARLAKRRAGVWASTDERTGRTGPGRAGRARPHRPVRPARPHGSVQRAVPACRRAARRAYAETLPQRARPRGARTARAAPCDLSRMPRTDGAQGASDRTPAARRARGSAPGRRAAGRTGGLAVRQPCGAGRDRRGPAGSGTGFRGDLRVLVRCGAAARTYRPACLATSFAIDETGQVVFLDTFPPLIGYSREAMGRLLLRFSESGLMRGIGALLPGRAARSRTPGIRCPETSVS
jgi:uncharacterized peroxidase-related enzyme